MKIVNIINGLGHGGAESNLCKVVLNDKKNTHIVISLTSLGIWGKKLIEEGVSVHSLNLNNYSLNLQSIKKIFKIINNYKPDLVHSWMYHSNLITILIYYKYKKIKIIWNIRGSFERKLTKLKTKFIIYLCSFFSNFVPSKIIYCSKYSMSVHEKIFYNKNKSLFIPNGFSIPKILNIKERKDSFLKHHKLNHKTFVIGMAARFDPHKDYENLFQVIKMTSRFEKKIIFLLAGEEMNYENIDLMNLINNFNIRDKIILLGKFANINDFYSILDMHILTSLSESFPNVIAESMSIGIPNIATDVGEAKNIIKNNGWIVSINNPKNFYQSLIESIKLFENQDSWNDLKKSCIEEINKNFSIEKMLSNYNKI